MAMTALPSPVKAGGTNPGAGGTAKAAATQSYESLKAAYNRLKSAQSNLTERQQDMVGDVICTVEIQGATFLTSVASGYAAKKGKSLKVMGADLRPIVGGGMVLAGVLMDDYGEHLLAIGNGVVASWTAEVGFDLGVRWGTSKAEIDAAKQGDKKIHFTRDIKVGELPDYQVGEGDEPPVRVSGDGARREPVRTRAVAEGDEEVGEDDEAGWLGLSVKERFEKHVRKWRVHNDKAQLARDRGNGRNAADEEGKAVEQKLKAMHLYNKYGEKKGLTLPSDWRKRKVTARGGQDGGDNDEGGGGGGGRVRVLRGRGPLGRRGGGRGPLGRRRREGDEDEDNFQFDQDENGDEVDEDFDAYVQNMSDEELEMMAGLEEESEEGMTTEEWPDDDEMGDEDEE